MKYKVEYSKKAEKALDKLSSDIRKRILLWVDKNINGCEDPRIHGKALVGDLKGQWRYRVGDYRILCDILDDIVTVLVIEIGHRREVYDN